MFHLSFPHSHDPSLDFLESLYPGTMGPSSTAFQNPFLVAGPPFGRSRKCKEDASRTRDMMRAVDAERLQMSFHGVTEMNVKKQKSFHKFLTCFFLFNASFPIPTFLILKLITRS